GHREKRDLCTARNDCLSALQKKFASPVDLDIVINRKFEERGIDVILSFSVESTQHEVASSRLSKYQMGWEYFESGWHPLSDRFGPFHIELKPVIGDDYPAVLRQMKRTKADVLVVGEYTGAGATREQFVKTMTTEGIRVVFVSEMATPKQGGT